MMIIYDYGKATDLCLLMMFTRFIVNDKSACKVCFVLGVSKNRTPTVVIESGGFVMFIMNNSSLNTRIIN